MEVSLEVNAVASHGIIDEDEVGICNTRLQINISHSSEFFEAA